MLEFSPLINKLLFREPLDLLAVWLVNKMAGKITIYYCEIAINKKSEPF
jgi:hypothetical protein